MIEYKEEDYYKKLNNEERMKIFNSSDTFITKTIEFEVNFKMSKGINNKKECYDYVYKTTYYEEVKNYIKDYFIYNNLESLEKIKNVKTNSFFHESKNLNVNEFSKFINNVFLFCLFEHFVKENIFYKSINIERVKYIHVLLAYKYGKRLIYKSISKKTLRTANNLGVFISYLEGETKNAMIREFFLFERHDLNINGQRRIIDLRQFYNYNSFYIEPMYLNEIIKLDKKDTIIVLPFYYETKSKLFNSKHHGSYLMIIEEEYLYEQIIKEMIKNAKNEITFVIPNLMSLKDYLFAFEYLKTFKEENSKIKIKIGIYVDDTSILESAHAYILKKLDIVIVSIDKIIRNNYYNNNEEYLKFSEGLTSELRSIRQTFRKSDTTQIISAIDEISSFNIEKLLNIGFGIFRLSHKNTQNYLEKASILEERRDKRDNFLKWVAKVVMIVYNKKAYV